MRSVSRPRTGSTKLANARTSSPRGLARRVERDLAALDAADPMNALSRLLRSWLRDETWVAAALEIAPVERRAWLASAGGRAFDRDWGGYASLLRDTTAGLDYAWPCEARETILRRHTQSLLANLSDILDFRYAGPNLPWEEVNVVGGDNLREALGGGRGVIALSVHQSHPGFAFLHPDCRDVRISTVANLGDRAAPHASLLLDGLRDRVELLPTTPAALRPMLGRLAGGGCVAMYCDYLYPGTPGTLSALFGGPVFVASAAVSVALRTGAAVIPVSVVRQWPPESAGVEVRFGAPLPLDGWDGRDPADHDAAAVCFGVAMECMIRRDPSAWRLWPALGYRWRSAKPALAALG